MYDMLKIVKTTKEMVDKKTNEKKSVDFYNLYLFGVAIKPVDQKQYLKLYYQVKGYLSNVESSKKE